MTKGRATSRNGVQGHIVVVERSERFVPNHYPGKDPRTIAAKKGSR